MTKDQKLKAFDTAHQNRLFEVELFWKRALFFWGFVASTFIAYVTISKTSQSIALVIACFGLVCSFVWSLANRGSKYWQEYWEKKVEELEDDLVGNLFIDDTPSNNSGWLSGRKFSVSKLSIAISDYLVLVWVSINAYELNKLYHYITFDKKTVLSCYILSSLMYIILIFNKTRSRIEVNNKPPKSIIKLE